MNVDLRILRLSGKGVQCTASSDTGASFWLPRGQHVEWSGVPEVGETVTADIPQWLASKHKQLVALRQCASRPLGKQETEVMANDTPRGALFRVPENDKKNDKWPDYRGDITIEGVKWKLAGWVREGKNGKFLSLVAKPFEEQPAKPAQGARAPADDAIPFAPEVR